MIPNEQLINLLEKHATVDFYVGKNIPKIKLDNAIAFFPINPEATVIGLIDCTIMGSCDVGLAITDDGLIWRNHGSKKMHLSWAKFLYNKSKIEIDGYNISFGNGAKFSMAGSRMSGLDAYRMFHSIAKLSSNLIRANVELFSKDNEYIVPVPNDMSPDERLIKLLQEHSTNIFYVGNNIPKYKMDNAIKHFPINHRAKVLGLIDCTLMGSCENGLAITDCGLSWKNNETPTTKTHLSWDEFLSNKSKIEIDGYNISFGNGAKFSMVGGRMSTVDAWRLFHAMAELLSELIKGKVKWLSNEKGYGYIVGNDGKDYYYNIRDIRGTNLPRNGDVVSFEGGQGQKGPKASSVSIINSVQATSTCQVADDRVTCSHCRKKMVPRMITYRGEPSKSVCPFCAGTYKTFGGCFITTAVCQYKGFQDDCNELEVLRYFRDSYLLSTDDGRSIVNHYYSIAPVLAERLVQQSDLEQVWGTVIDCVNAIESGRYQEALVIYKTMVLSLQERLTGDEA